MNPPHRSSARLPALWASMLAAFLIVLAAPAAWAAPCEEGILFDDPVRSQVGPGPLFVVTGDFDEDGLDDLAITVSDYMNSGDASTLVVRLATAPGVFAPPVSYPVGSLPFGVITGDFDEDGILDLAVAVRGENGVAVLRGLGSGGVGNGTFESAHLFPAGPTPHQILSADINEDGIADLAVSNNAIHGISVLPGLGSGGVGNGQFGAPVTFGIDDGPVGIDVADFDEDGHSDLVATEYYTGTVAVLFGTGNAAVDPSSFESPVHLSAGPEPWDLAVADLNEDGNQDLLVSNSSFGGTAIMLGNGSGGFAPPAFLASGNTAFVLPVDVNQDGILDLLTGSTAGAQVMRLYPGQGAGGVGNGTFGPPSSYPLSSDPYYVAVADFDDDGSLDAVVTHFLADDYSYLRGTCEAAPPEPPDFRKPVLTDVRDVPNDQGGRVFVTWTASSLDVTGGSVNQYRVWRRIPAALALARRAESEASITIRRETRAEGATELVYWEALATLPAQRMPAYGYTAATTQDSMRHSNPYTAFFVSALTSNIDVFFDSNVDSGYSVDNIRPRRPRDEHAQVASEGLLLEWVGEDDPDLGGFRVYRGATHDFEPSAASLIAEVLEPAYLDPGAAGDQYYKITAIDTHENESDPAIVTPLVALGAGDPLLRDALSVTPNPSRTGALAIRFSLATRQDARLEVVDLAGRRIVADRFEQLEAGSHAFTLDGARRLRPGMYFVRLVLGARVLETKAVVMR